MKELKEQFATLSRTVKAQYKAQKVDMSHLNRIKREESIENNQKKLKDLELKMNMEEARQRDVASRRAEIDEPSGEFPKHRKDFTDTQRISYINQNGMDAYRGLEL